MLYFIILIPILFSIRKIDKKFLYFYETFLEGDIEAEDKKDRPNGGCS